MTLDQIKQEATSAKAQGQVVVMSATKLLELVEQLEADAIEVALTATEEVK